MWGARGTAGAEEYYGDTISLLRAESVSADINFRADCNRNKTYCVAEAGTGADAGTGAAFAPCAPEAGVASAPGVAGKAGLTIMGADADGAGLSCASFLSE